MTHWQLLPDQASFADTAIERSSDMPIDFRRHDATAKNLPAADRQTYAAKKSELIKKQVPQAEADEVLNAFFWQCFEDDEEDEEPA